MELVETTRSISWIVFLLAFTLIGWFIYKQLQYHVWKLPPGPLGLPILGYLPFIACKDPQEVFDQLRKKYGPIFSVSLGSFNVVVVTAYEYAKELLIHPASLDRPDKFMDFLPAKGGFGGMNGDVWQEQRRFCVQTMRNLGLGKGPWEKMIQEDVVDFVEYLQQSKGKPINVSQPLTLSVTSNNAALLIGRRFVKKAADPDVKIIETAHHVITEHGKMTNPTVVIPWLLKYFVKFNIDGYAHKMDVIHKFGDIFRREIMKHQASEEEADSMDFIGYYLQAQKKKEATGEKKYYSVENLLGHMALLFMAGSDTTVSSVHWILVLMAGYPDVQAKVQLEVDSVIGRDGQAGWDDRKNLPYTMAAILEMERWASIVPFFPPRNTAAAIKVRGYIIPKDTMVLTNGHFMQRDANYWDNPDDYVPERFLDSSRKSGKDPLKLDGYAPFSFGKRKCPGETIALMTIFLYFVGIMQKFTITPPPGYHAKLSATSRGIMHPQEQELCFIER